MNGGSDEHHYGIACLMFSSSVFLYIRCGQSVIPSAAAATHVMCLDDDVQLASRDAAAAAAADASITNS